MYACPYLDIYLLRCICLCLDVYLPGCISSVLPLSLCYPSWAPTEIWNQAPSMLCHLTYDNDIWLHLCHFRYTWYGTNNFRAEEMWWMPFESFLLQNLYLWVIVWNVLISFCFLIFINIWFVIWSLNKYILYAKMLLKAHRPLKVANEMKCTNEIPKIWIWEVMCQG